MSSLQGQRQLTLCASLTSNVMEIIVEIMVLGVIVLATGGAVNLLTGFGLYDLKRRHRLLQEQIERTSRGEKERIALQESERAKFLMKLLLAALVILLFYFYRN